MGEISDSMINGDFDFHTGEYLGKGGGFPRTHNKSLPWESGKIKSQNVAWKQVPDFLTKSGLKPHLHTLPVKEYGVKYEGEKPFKNACFEILNDFENFKLFAADWIIANNPVK